MAETVVAPIEQQVNGVEKMLYMQSSSSNDGSYSLMVTFEQGVNMNMAQVLVQNRVNLAMPLLPDVIKQSGVTMRKMSPDIVKVINFNSPDGRYNQLYLSNFVFTRVRDEMLRVEGVGDVFLIGQRDYSMRIWVDPDKLAFRGLTTDDVVTAIRGQNAEVACGYLGQAPYEAGPGDANQALHARPLHDARTVRQNRHPHGGGRQHDAAEGRRPHRVGGEEPGRHVQARRQGIGRPGDFPVARRQRVGARRPHHGQDEGARADVPGRLDL